MEVSLVSDIPVDISNEDFEERLETEILGFGEAKVVRQSGCHAREYKIEWVSNGGDKPQMDVSDCAVRYYRDQCVCTVQEKCSESYRLNMYHCGYLAEFAWLDPPYQG